MTPPHSPERITALEPALPGDRVDAMVGGNVRRSFRAGARIEPGDLLEKLLDGTVRPVADPYPLDEPPPDPRPCTPSELAEASRLADDAVRRLP